MNLNLNLIKINVTISDLCPCFLNKYPLNIFRNFSLNCIFTKYPNYIDIIKNNPEAYIVIFITDFSNNTFYRDSYITYAYRKQYNFEIPVNCTNFYNDIHYKNFIIYLIKEYITEKDKYKNISNNDMFILKLKNPLYICNKISCVKNNDNLIEKIIIIPGITF